MLTDAVEDRSARWEKATELASLGLAADGYADSTIERVLKHVRRFGRDVRQAPFDVTAVDVTRWLSSLKVAPRHGYALRTSLRTFYRWAFRTGRVFVDPTEHTSHLQQRRDAPAGWQAAITGYRRFLTAAKLSQQTIRLRVYQITRFASETHVADPWRLTTQHMLEWLGGHPWTRESVYSYRSVLRSFYRWAFTVGHVQRDPAADLPAVRLRPPRHRPAPEDAYRAALAAADDRVRLMLRLAAELGLRAGEVATVHTGDIVTGSDCAYWLDVSGKGDRTRTLPLPDDLASVLLDRDAGYVFPGQIEGHLSRAYVTRLMSAVLPDQHTAHSLRHRFATRAYAIDRDVFSTQELLGHASPETTRRYVQVLSANLRRLVEAAR